MKITRIFSTNIQRLRDKMGWSQMRLAEEAGIGHQTIFRAESKNVLPHGEKIEKIAAALGVEIYVLFSDPDSVSNKVQDIPNETLKLITEMSVKAAKDLDSKNTLSNEEQELIDILRGVSDKDRRRVIVDTARRLANVKDRQLPARRLKAR